MAREAAADEFAALGATVVDTDAIAHELTEKGARRCRIEKLLGSEAVSADGSMNRKKVRERVFADPAAKQKLGRCCTR